MNTLSSIVVVGSSNTDMVIKADHFPVPGETILGGSFFMFPGGKGANQAVAAARLGGEVTLIAKIGNDVFGKQSLELFQKEGIDVDFVSSDDHQPSGVALITIDQKGENTIVVAQGANAALTRHNIEQGEKKLEQAALVLIQLEIPMETVAYVINCASRLNKKVILNPAPAQQLPDELLGQLYLITPNESEAGLLLGMPIDGIESVKVAAKKLFKKGIKNVVITLGADGAYLFNAEGGKHIPTMKVKPIDTTAAGDVFNGALAVAISENKAMPDAIAFANQAASISVTRMGAQASAPYRNEIKTNH